MEAMMRLSVWMAAAVLGAVVLSGEAFAQEVSVTLRDVEPRGGKILASLQTEDQFMKGRGAYGIVVDPPATRGSVTLVFPDVAPGEYALSVMHDENGDYQMQKQANGMPAEGYAMSHGGSMTGPPTWDTAKFTVGAAPVSMDEAMYYPWVPPAAATGSH
jgi:uncharacterized protein (DUF2141 family)